MLGWSTEGTVSLDRLKFRARLTLLNMNIPIRQVLLCTFLLNAGGGTFAAELRSLRAGTELFVDDVGIARRENLRRTVHAAVKPAAPVIEPDRPWEGGRVYIYGTTHYDESTRELKMWYGSSRGGMLYATSRDGLRWNKPEMGMFEVDGQKTNIVLTGSAGASVLVDETEPDPSRRYKALVAEHVRSGGFRGFHSPDGLHWTGYSPERVLTTGSEMGTVIRDPATGKYFAYVRPYRTKLYPTRPEDKRLGAVATSDDFVHWSALRVVLTPDAVDDAWVSRPEQRTEFYAMNGFAYGRSYLGIVPLLRVIRIIEKPGKEQSPVDGPMEGQLIVSRDGLAWNRMAERNPVIPSGREFDQSVMNVATAPILMGDEVWHYYTGINTTHGGPLPPKRIAVCLAKWRLDGFVSLDARETEGLLETTLIADRRGRLEVNVNAAGGRLVVEVLDGAGNVLPGFSAAECVVTTADSVRQAVRWAKHSELPRGGAYALRFRLKNAELYSYTVVPAR